MSVGLIITSLINYYEWAIIVYILMSWLRPGPGLVGDVYRMLGTICEPWLGIFRRVIPPLGMMDFSPVVAVIALNLISSLVYRVLG